MYALSVAVAIYNSEKYLKECLDSLVNQTLENIELILVSDASPDNSIAIMREYQAKYPNKVKIVELEKNGRLGGARQAGLQAAQGEYFAYVDGDDYVDCSMYEKMISVAQENSSEVVSCWECRFDSETKQKTNHKYGGGFCKIVKIEFLRSNKIEFITNNVYSDNYFWSMVELYSTKTNEIQECLYYAREQRDSIRHTTSSKNIKDRMEAEEQLISDVVSRNLEKTVSDDFFYNIVARYCVSTFYLFALIDKMDYDLFRYYVNKTNRFLNENLWLPDRTKLYKRFSCHNRVLLWILRHSKRISFLAVVFSAVILKRVRIMKRWIQSKR